MANYNKQKDFTKGVNNKVNNKEKNQRKPLRKGGIDELKAQFGNNVVELASIVKNNAEIRRFTAIGIINYLKNKGIIGKEHNRVSFKWNKFTVISDGLISEYKYTELFFINSLVASFSNFSSSAQRIIDNFCKTELNSNIQESVDENEVNNIVENNEQHVNASNQETEIEIIESTED